MPQRRHIIPGWWRHLPDADRDGVYDKLTTIAWAVAFGLYTPPAYAQLFDLATTASLLTLVVVGGVVGIVGRIRHDLRVEVFGIGFMLLGWAVYIGVQLLFLGVGVTARIPLTVLAFFQFRHYWGRGLYLVKKYLRNRYLAGDPMYLFGRVLTGGMAVK